MGNISTVGLTKNQQFLITIPRTIAQAMRLKKPINWSFYSTGETLSYERFKMENTDNEKIIRLIQYCKANHIEKIGIAYCYSLEPEARYLIRELDDEVKIIASACNECDSIDIEVTDSEASRIARYFNAHKIQITLILGLCPLQFNRFLKEIRSISTTVRVKS